MKIGDKVYIRKVGHSYDFSEWQIAATITSIENVPTYGGHHRKRVKLYLCTTDDGRDESSYFQDEYMGKKRRMIRTTPFPDLKIRA